MTLNVATVPDTHPYIGAVVPSAVRHRRFSGPDATGWEPSPLLDRRLRRHLLPELDVVHVHFGYEGCSREQLDGFVADVGRAGVALVVTVHDLRNPHDRDPVRHDQHLTSLLGAADAVVTLTAAAAVEIERRWARVATVLAHPTLLTDDSARTPPRRSVGDRPRVIGVHLKSLRPNVVDPIPLVLAAAAGARSAGAMLRVDVHDPGADPSVLRALTARAGAFTVHRHDRFSDAELLAYLHGLDVSVLPYRFGTHSGWLELCRDLGVTVVAPDCGHYAGQWSQVVTYTNNERTGLDPSSLHQAVRAAVDRARPEPADRAARVEDARQIQAAHERLYAEALRSRRRAGAA